MYSLNNKEGFIQEKEFLFKKGPDIYDEFYASIYDHLVFNDVKNDYNDVIFELKNMRECKDVRFQIHKLVGILSIIGNKKCIKKCCICSYNNIIN